MKKLLPLTLALACVSTVAMANDYAKGSKMHHGQHFAKMDANGDGKVTRAEHEAFAQQMFRKQDANNDGVITKDEMMAYKKSEYGKSSMAPSAGGNPNSDPTSTGNVDPQKRALEDNM